MPGQGYIAAFQQFSLNKLPNLEERCSCSIVLHRVSADKLSPATCELVISLLFGEKKKEKRSTVNMQREVLVLIQPSRRGDKMWAHFQINDGKHLSQVSHANLFLFSHFLGISQVFMPIIYVNTPRRSRHLPRRSRQMRGWLYLTDCHCFFSQNWNWWIFCRPQI